MICTLHDMHTIVAYSFVFCRRSGGLPIVWGKYVGIKGSLKAIWEEAIAHNARGGC